MMGCDFPIGILIWGYRADPPRSYLIPDLPREQGKVHAEGKSYKVKTSNEIICNGIEFVEDHHHLKSHSHREDY